MARSLEQRVRTLTQRVEATWRSHFSGAPVDLPLSAVAALAQLRGPDPRAARDTFLDLPQDQAVHVLRLLWHRFGSARPDLAYRVLPLARWTHGTDSRDQQCALVAVARAAVTADLFDLTMHTQARASTDLFGPLLMALRPKKACERNGQFYTPADVAELLARVTNVPEPGAWICDPAVGTGGLVLAVAEQIRARGLDPADMHWDLVDIDPVAAACLAVNAHLWQLGPNVLIGCGDALVDDWRPLALYERDLGIRTRRVRELYHLVTAPHRHAPAA